MSADLGNPHTTTTFPTGNMSSIGSGLDLGGATLTPDALMAYLETRMSSLDGRIDEIFQKQQKAQALRGPLNKIKQALGRLNEHATDKNAPVANGEFEAEINAQLEALKQIDPQLAAQVKKDLNKDGHILFTQDGSYRPSQIEPSRQYIDDVLGDIDASSQMDMIKMQSMMSSRQTAISLSTNLISSLGQSTNKIADNVGR